LYQIFPASGTEVGVQTNIEGWLRSQPRGHWD